MANCIPRRRAFGFISLVLGGSLAVGAFGQTGERTPVYAGTDFGRQLTAPPEQDEFSFVIFGDRTGGPRSGLKVLEDGVTMANRLGPAFVMTVGDLVEGYNKPEEWLAQAKEYQEIMSGLAMPWYPVLGNHDVYARPHVAGGHLDLFKQHFGPLYYSFDYRWAHFICLFSDEKLSFSNPAENQNVGPEQMEWLRRDLQATDARQIFVFLHHPRWTSRYLGCNWDDVHKLLTDGGRVVAVISGHVHEIRDDGVRDGIRYHTLATTGGHRGALSDSAAIHHVNLVRVRPGEVAMCVLPIGSVLGSDVVLGSEVDEMRALLGSKWLGVDGRVDVALGRECDSTVRLTVTNPTTRPLAFSAKFSVPEGWTLTSAVLKSELAPGKSVELEARFKAPALRRGSEAWVRLNAALLYKLASGITQPIKVVIDVPVSVVGLGEPARAQPAENKVLVLDGKSAARVNLFETLEGLNQFTLECWVRGSKPSGRTALLTKTENSSFGLFWCDQDSEDRLPTGYVHLGRFGYLKATASRGWEWERWTHVALTYDGERLRLFVGGKLSAEGERAGRISANRLPLYIGADPDRHGKPVSYFTGAIDEVRLSSVARYTGEFEPAKNHQRDEHTVLLLHFNNEVEGIFPDDSGKGNHGWSVGTPTVKPEQR